MSEINVIDWTSYDVYVWAKRESQSKIILDCISLEDIDGKCLLTLNENDIRDFRDKCGYKLKISDIKRFFILIRNLQRDNYSSLSYLGLATTTTTTTTTEHCSGSNSCSNYNISIPCHNNQPHHHSQHHHYQHNPTQHLQHNTNNNNNNNVGFHIHPITSTTSDFLHHLHHDIERISPPLSVDGRATSIQPEFFKTMISLGYAFLVTWITAFVMVVVHERVPDMKRYPPLPDIFLDNVPHIPWAFHMCEITGTLLFSLWLCVLIVHKHRMVLLRRFFALSGTVFLLRCVTMLITSLSVPGTHLQCNPNDYKVDDINLTLMEAVLLRISRAYTIWSGLGMSIQGVRTCGDYMFSGHTVALTILNFFITEYTPRNLYFLHTITWLLNMFGIFFILAAHEHYSIDVFVAFYITSRLFLYYHTLANNQALMSHDSNRTRIWFPMFSYFESSVDGIIPNEYDTIKNVCCNIFLWIISIKDCCMLTARRFWIAHNQMTPIPLTKHWLRQSLKQQQQQQQQHQPPPPPPSPPQQQQQQQQKLKKLIKSSKNLDLKDLNCKQQISLLSKSLNNLQEINNKKVLQMQNQEINNNNIDNLKINADAIICNDSDLIKNNINIDKLKNKNITKNDDGSELKKIN